MSRRASIALFLAAIVLLLVAQVADAAPDDPLLGTEWWVEDIDGGGVIDRSHTTLHFVAAGRVAGDGGCNRYMGEAVRDGADLTFGRLAGTMMACPQALLNQEQRFHDALGRVRSWRIDARTGLLHLQNDAGETVVRAHRISPDATTRVTDD